MERKITRRTNNNKKNGRTLLSCRRPLPFIAVRARRPPLLRREENEGSEDDGEVDDGEAREGRKKNAIKHEEGEGFGDDGDGERPNVCVCVGLIWENGSDKEEGCIGQDIGREREGSVWLECFVCVVYKCLGLNYQNTLL